MSFPLRRVQSGEQPRALPTVSELFLLRELSSYDFLIIATLSPPLHVPPIWNLCLNQYRYVHESGPQESCSDYVALILNLEFVVTEIRGLENSSQARAPINSHGRGRHVENRNGHPRNLVPPSMDRETGSMKLYWAEPTTVFVAK